MFEFIRSILATRGLQLVARGLQWVFVWLGTQTNVIVAPDAVDTTTQTIAAFVVAGLLFLYDLVAHSVQKRETIDKSVADRVHRSQWSGMILLIALPGVLCFAGCKPTGKVDAVVNPQTGEIIVTGGIEWKKLRAREIAACKAASQEQMKLNMAAFTTEQNRLCKECKLCEYVDVIAGEPFVPSTTLPNPAAGLLPESGTGGK